MDIILITIKSQTNEPQVVLTLDKKDLLYMKQDAAQCYLNKINTKKNEVIPGFGSHIQNVITINSGELVLDPLLRKQSQYGHIIFKEPEKRNYIDVSVTANKKGQVVILYFENIKTAKRFVEKKLIGEMIIANSEEGPTLPFYPLFREAYLFSSTSLEIGLLGYLDCINTIIAPTANIKKLSVRPDEKVILPIENTTYELKLTVWKKVRLEFNAGSQFNIIRMNRTIPSILDSSGQVAWEIHDEIFKIFVS